MAKEIAIKVKVEGSEITMTGKQLDNFKKTVESLKKQLELLGSRTEENGEQFDKLKGDLDALNMAFGETNEEVKDTTNNLNDNEDQVDKTSKATKSYAAQIRSLRTELSALGDRTEDNAVQYDALATKIRDLSEKQEDLQFGTKKLDDALSGIPGPIGRAASSFKMLDDTFKNAKGAMRALTAQFPILKSAIAATGIGALVIVFGLLVGAIMRAFNTFKPLQQAVKNFGVLFDVLGKAIQPIIDIIGNLLTKSLEKLSQAIAFVTGQTKEYNKELADKKAAEEYIKSSNERIAQAKLEAMLLTGVRKKYQEEFVKYLEKNKQDYEDYLEKIKTLDEEGISNKEVYNKRLLLLDNELNIKRQNSITEYGKVIIELQQIFSTEELKLQNEKAILLLKKEKDKELESLRQQKEAQDKSINELIISEEEKQKLIDLSGQIYLLKQKEINKKYSDEQKKANQDLNKMIRDIRTSFIEDERDRFIKEQENRMSDDIEIINQSIASETIKGEAIKAVKQKYLKELEQFDIEYSDKLAKQEEDKTKKDAVTLWNRYQFDLDTTQMFYDAKLKQLENSHKYEYDKIIERRSILQDMALSDFEAEVAGIKKLEDEKEITVEQGYQRRLALDEKYAAEKVAIEEDTYNRIIELIGNYAGALDLVNSSIGELINVMDKESKAAKALIKIQQALTAVTMSLAAAQAFMGLMKDISKGFPINVIAIASTLAATVSAIAAWATLFKSTKPDGVSSSSSTSSSNSTPNYGKNYADGGMIGGKRHAQGGTLIEAEQGEAIMTRGAVSMFKPMLSLMNQMGGGKSFDARLVKNDNPITKQPSQEPMIIKTFVVSTDMTKEQEKYARLKNLSTI